MVEFHNYKDLDEEEQEEVLKEVTKFMKGLVQKGLTNMDQMNMCHTCGDIILNCKCEDCQCNMHKDYRKKHK